MKRAATISLLLGLAASPALAASLTPEQAANHIGQTDTVCGTVASAHYAERSGTTFLNLGQPYPRQVFTVVIFRDARALFGEPERTFAGKRLCIRGEIRSYHNQPEIILNRPSQLEPAVEAE
jgi:DNA/RNA endonuclease YhcR with UshA esterase domain